jgi:hypothetical protein
VKRDGVAVGLANAMKLDERVHVSFLANPERRGDAFLRPSSVAAALWAA